MDQLRRNLPRLNQGKLMALHVTGRPDGFRQRLRSLGSALTRTISHSGEGSYVHISSFVTRWWSVVQSMLPGLRLVDCKDQWGIRADQALQLFQLCHLNEIAGHDWNPQVKSVWWYSIPLKMSITSVWFLSTGQTISVTQEGSFVSWWVSCLVWCLLTVLEKGIWPTLPDCEKVLHWNGSFVKKGLRTDPIESDIWEVWFWKYGIMIWQVENGVCLDFHFDPESIVDSWVLLSESQGERIVFGYPTCFCSNARVVSTSVISCAF